MRRRYRHRSPTGAGPVFGVLVLAAFYHNGYTRVTDQLPMLAVEVGVVTLVAVLLVAMFRRFRTRIPYGKLDGIAFERYVASLLPHLGFTNVRLTERYDLGIDIIAYKDGMVWGVQVKHYSGLVKASAVRQVVTAMKYYGCERVMVVTNSQFSRPAIELARSNGCVLVDGRELPRWRN